MEGYKDELPTIEALENLIERNDLTALREALSGVHPADVADVLEELSAEDAVTAFSLLPDFEASEVLDEANSSLTAELMESVDDERIADLLDTLPMDDAAELLEDLPQGTAERLLGLMEPEESREVRAILSYPEDSAGRLMTQDVAVLRANWTVSQAFDYLRALTETETLHYLYVVDAVGHLTGVVPIRNLVLAQPHRTIGEIAIPDPIHVYVDTDQEEMAEIFARYDYTVLPVNDAEEKLQGIVTVDDVIDILAEETTEDIQQLGGSSPLEQPYFSVPTWVVMRKRVGWLLLLFFASLLSGSVVAIFNNRISPAIMATLTIFITLVIGTGGNAGSQTVATIIRAIAIEEVRLGDLWRALRREIAAGFMMGAVLGAAGFIFAAIYAYLQHDNIAASIHPLRIALVVACTLPLVVVWSNTIATIIPILAERFKIDPTVVSAPMITTIVDATGLLIYYSLAIFLLS